MILITLDEKSTFSDTLSKTGDKISEVSRRLGSLTKNAFEKTAESTKSSVSKANESIKKSIQESKEKREKNREEKLDSIKNDLKGQDLLEPVPPMITLPEFQQEHVEIAQEQQEILNELVEHLQRLSSRLDDAETKLKSIHQSNLTLDLLETTARQTENQNSEHLTSEPMKHFLAALGASLIWVALLFGGHAYIRENNFLIANTYPAEIPMWSIGIAIWSFMILHRLGKAASIFKVSYLLKFQSAIAIGLTTMTALLLTNDVFSTMSTIWRWGLLSIVILFIGIGVISTIWNSFARVFSRRKEIEIIH